MKQNKNETEQNEESWRCDCCGELFLESQLKEAKTNMGNRRSFCYACYNIVVKKEAEKSASKEVA